MQDKKRNIVYLLGAGFSHAITNGRAPLTSELGNQLKGVFPQEIEEKYGFSPEYIELFLTKIDLENNNSELQNPRDKLRAKILELFATKKLSNINKSNNQIEISDSAEKIANILFKPGDTILTINYDCYLENVLLKKGKWSPNKGWGDIFMFPDTIYLESEIKIFKLHGSVNFILVAPLDKDGMFNREKLMLQHIIDDEYFPGWRSENSWEGTIREYVVLPSYLKQFEYKGILSIWKSAALRIREADKLVVIGSSLRKEDYPLRFLISLIKENTKIIVIDPSATCIKNKLISNIPINPSNIKALPQKIETVSIEISNEIYNE